MDAARQSFGELLRQHRMAAGVSQEELAERARLSADTISALERGTRQKPYRDTIALLADALGLSQEARAEMERAARPSFPAMAVPRSGVVTFLLAEVEGGTNARPYELLSTAVETHDGAVFETTSDAFCAAFARAEDAVSAAIHAQHAWRIENASADEVLTIRMALHSGKADLRLGASSGTELRQASRLLEVAHGGQILVSATSSVVLHGKLGNGVSLRDLGAHRLRDLARPESIYQLEAPGLEAAFPPIRSLESLPNNLPTQLSSFVGRDNDAAEIEQLITENRLVTLVGTGGIGKTRMALHVAADLLDGSGGGVWFVDLAPLADASLVASAIAVALNAQVLPNRTPLETLIAYLKNKYLLLVLDNCEHLIEGAARTAEAILQSCPRVHILATSREALGIRGERTYRVPSLSVPSHDELRTLDVEGALKYGAIALFVDRATSADQRFALTEQLVPVVGEICRRLDGIALAIELAAARVNVLAAATLAEKLNERFLILTGGSRTALPRHKTMRALLDWSYDLLEDREQRAFRSLSIFAGGFTLEAAAAVCEAEDSESPVLDLLVSLVDKSLVQAEFGSETTRYIMLESTRQYAYEKLNERGEYATVARAHARAMLALAERFDSPLAPITDRVWAAQLKPEIENWRAALEWAFSSQGDSGIGRRLVWSLRAPWFSEAAPIEGLRWIHVALQTCDDDTSQAERARLALSEALVEVSLPQTPTKTSHGAAERALTLYRQAGDTLGISEAQMLCGFGMIYNQRLAEGEKLVRDAFEVARSLGARGLTARAVHILAQAKYFEGDLETARRLYREALSNYKDLGLDRAAARIASNVAELEFLAGNVDAALRLADEATVVLRGINNWVAFAGTLCNRCAYLIAQNRFDDARSGGREALSNARDIGFDMHIIWALQHLAAVGALQRHDDNEGALPYLQRAARVLGFVNARFLAIDSSRQYTEQQEYDRVMPVLSEALGNDLGQLMGEGERWSEDRAVEEALRI